MARLIPQLASENLKPRASTACADPRRRQLLTVGAALALPAIGGCARAPARATPRLELQSLPGFFDDLEQRTFAFFWETANPNNGLLPDRWPSSWAASIASVGFALTAYPIGVERGYITRTQASDRVLTTLRFFANAPQGVQESGTSGYRGFFYHFLDMQTGTRWLQREISTVDTALLLAGMLVCQSWFDRSESRDVEIRELVDTIYARVDWNWMQVRVLMAKQGRKAQVFEFLKASPVPVVTCGPCGPGRAIDRVQGCA